jgi:hypothetical protein
MKYKLRKRLQDDTDYYAFDTITKYIDYLEEKGVLIRFGNLCYDRTAMLTPFVCDTRLCIPCRDGKTITGKRRRRTCCGGYAPRLSTKERERIDEILPRVTDRFPKLSRRIDRNGGYYEWDDDFERLLMRPEGDWCIFMARDAKEFGFHPCLIHAYCLEQNIDPKHYKPAACVMFPIVLFETDDAEPDQMLVTRHTKETMNLGEEEDEYTALDCCKRNPLAKEPLYQSMRDTLVYMFGEAAWNKLHQELSKE